MTILCTTCGQTNSDDSAFCNKCGDKVSANENIRKSSREIDLNSQTKVCINEFTESIKLITDQVKYKTLEDFQQKATKWIHYQFIAVTTAASIVIAVLAYVGYNGFNLKEMISEQKGKVEEFSVEFNKLVTDNKNLLADGNKELNQLKQAALEEAGKAQDIASKKILELSNIKTDEITDLDKRLNKRINEFTKLQKQLDDQVQKINRIERSRYQIIVHYAAVNVEDIKKNNFDDMQTALYKKGFILDTSNIFNVSTDRQEILYYSNTKDMSDKVDEIISGLPNRYKPITKRLVKSGNNDPFQIVFKLCARGFTEGTTCNNK